MLRLSLDDLSVASYETSSAHVETSFAVACTTTLDSLVEHLCPGGLITYTCHGGALLAE